MILAGAIKDCRAWWASLQAWRRCLEQMLRVSRKSKPLFLQNADRGEAHMAEELHNASYVLPRILVWAPIVNGFLAFVMLITFCYCIGDEAAGECPNQRTAQSLKLRCRRYSALDSDGVPLHTGFL